MDLELDECLRKISMPQAIKEFKGTNVFLSNFYLHPVKYGSLTYRSNEHAYQAAKTKSLKSRKLVQKAATPGQAKRLGRNLELRPDWESVKVNVMRKLIRRKFADPILREMLLATVM